MLFLLGASLCVAAPAKKEVVVGLKTMPLDEQLDVQSAVIDDENEP